ncbi:MAG: Peptidase S8 and S53, subtilisin, kexin, sedolisin [Candidatus Magasanikbacteria bacterium GW2011_GWD2_43_18]|uniref:Peptidase S8 and S53, subtilisin, kexin, sedolisin n=1 Tax=Candidatus Magasanikbacteria bacterium GW2011_GWE2_42_7 TaxID=1619052 RepID=A0A0G1DP28_9BACT|nr:MAG: Peptidase S8 and S53, subtilisin, kexin, sedolisin [Candidatus Magasanikbacteria bacterium GW2011_GWC2_42_27]KKS72561.1 MAG: Peptidase S8 and S53, subtilisin, kexin, sedolisin [Candidatus Magasanikbacteria bacterium GW2011_GWE2_42_7]KKT05267.1 MAG: Peptidase S8 and S53, subtilisin, kexin, sedolisin [Candidatus Magasanikbacteria bacterium GW2011_GWD2_43_18]KKT26111.1 MAG: Peptidase S8 and S53, subtilisin, kexin, sedolisin [Candidatus Magasanikbacteria bacterium GW2011_GWA2_43_9]HBB37603.
MHCKYFPTIVTIFACVVIAGPANAANLSDPLYEQWAFQDIGVYAAWDYTQGSKDVVVAVIDNGFDTFHPDLRDNVWKNEDEIPSNNIDDDHNGYIDDVWGWSFIPEDINKDGALDDSELIGTNDPRPRVSALNPVEKEEGIVHHGTAVAGLIGAVGGNGKGISGVAPHVRLMNLRVVDETGRGTLTMLDEAIYYAVDNGADVINMSMVGTTDQDIHDAIEYAYDHDVVVVAAAGNTRQDLNIYPLDPICADALSDEVHILGVSSITREHRLSMFSNSGLTCVDITAPGEDITSTVRFSPTHGLSDQYLPGWAGTSFSTPLVSGAAALIKSIQPFWGARQIYDALLSTVHHTSGQDEREYENLFGAGLLQVDKAVAYAYAQITQRPSEESLWFVSPSLGMSQNMTGDVLSIENHEALKGIDDFVVKRKENTTVLVTTKKDTRSTRRVTIYDISGDWNEIGGFVVPASGPLEIAMKQDDIILSPTYAATTVFWVYSQKGVLTATYALHVPHGGVSMAVSAKGDLYTVSKQEDVLTVQIFTESLEEAHSSFQVHSLSLLGNIAVGDIDGDLQDEVVLGGAVGERPYVSYYDADGTYKRTFSVYSAYQSGFSLLVTDHDSDGKDDVVTIPYNNTEVVRVWTNKSKKIAEWNIFQTYSLSDITAINY